MLVNVRLFRRSLVGDDVTLGTADEFAAGTDVHTFETSGSHEYYCILHETAGTTGIIVLE